jgi:hypothetical protein
MELNDLKLAWNKFSSKDATQHQLDEEAIYDMLKKRTKNLIERIDRNIKIGFGVLVLLTVFFVLDDFFLTPILAGNIEIPTWILIIDGISTLFILSTFIYFSLSYRSVKKTYSHSNDLRHVLQSIIRILNFYRILFYMALAILLFVLSVSFITGLLVGVELKAVELGASWIELGSSPQMAKTIILGVMLLLAFVTGFFILFRWGYRKLYGNYIAELKKTLQELDEIERFD